jgi:hypothetical protein
VGVRSVQNKEIVVQPHGNVHRQKESLQGQALNAQRAEETTVIVFGKMPKRKLPKAISVVQF